MLGLGFRLVLEMGVEAGKGWRQGWRRGWRRGWTQFCTRQSGDGDPRLHSSGDGGGDEGKIFRWRREWRS